jgi:archaellum component FlaC
MNSREGKTELVWVSKEQAERYNKLESDDERYKAFEEYMKTVSLETQKQFKADLEGIEEDVAVYSGLLLKVKQSYKNVQAEHYAATYKLWEDFDKELPSTSAKIEKIISTLDPLAKKLNELNNLIKTIKTWDVEKLIETIEKLSGMYGTNQKMVEFLVNNFKREEK